MSNELPTRQLIMNFAMQVAMLLILGACAFFTYAAFYPVEVIHLNRVPMRVLTPSVLRGSTGVLYEIDYCKSRETIATLAVEIVATDGRDISVPLPLTGMSLPVGCHIHHSSMPIPLYVLPGRYKVRITRMYSRSAYFDTPPVLETEPFEVVQ